VGTVFGLLIATAAAFVITEKLKLAPSPILDTVVSKTFSPVCTCATRRAQVSFRLRHGGRVEVDVIRPGGALVRRLARHRFAAGVFSFRWFGRDESGKTGPDGDYQIRVHLFSQHRTIVLPNVIRLDTVPPKVERIRFERRVVFVGERLRVDYLLGEVAHPILLVDGRAVVLGRFPFRSGALDWYGTIDGKPARTGLHRLALEARDSAGNVSPPTASVIVRIRARPAAHSRPPKRAKR
jgi:FlgD Ig-like domain